MNNRPMKVEIAIKFTTYAICGTYITLKTFRYLSLILLKFHLWVLYLLTWLPHQTVSINVDTVTHYFVFSFSCFCFFSCATVPAASAGVTAGAAGATAGAPGEAATAF